MNLHDWIDELADVLDVEAEVDEGLVLDLARVAAQNVQKTAAPITTYLLGFAAAPETRTPSRSSGSPPRPSSSPRAGTGPPTRPDPDDVDDEVPDDSSVDHSTDLYED